MLHKWKFILTNWINCFHNSKTEQCITIDTLLTVISHLHKISLDESNASILEAQTVEEFIVEKYPEFKFENGTVEPTEEEDVYVVASLLLYFVCVNSKDVDIKQAMCSKLSAEDQETIMKFSKCLMECSSVTCRDVLAAITEACGEDTATGALSATVAATPPALRSLHGEVRRLQAALAAEQFDRNYLQDELARTNHRLEKLVKDKEQYKQDIMELKAKISLCCGQEAEAHSADGAGEGAARLQRQLNDAEDRLVAVREMLDDVTYERDTYKAKVEELKQERNKWLTVSQEETTRASQLAEELETERRRAMALNELVTELRQHRKNNGLDASQLECDDPDASMHSLHNASVCSEACANVIEVQLLEERAKIVTLKQQIDNLQDQVKQLTQQAENEKLSLEGIISEKDNDIFNLKHRINEEIEEKNNIKAQYDDAISKLNNEMNELEQRLRENSENSRATIEQKMQEIQTLQEEKLSLLQSLSDETTKLETIIKNLKTDIETEKNIKSKMKEDYDNQIMKLNEKVLNRNNELVELQNKVFENGDVIGQLQLDLKKERESNSELSNKYNNDIKKLNEEKTTLERNLHQKTEEAKELQRRLSQNVAVFAELNKEIDDLKAANEDLVENYRILEDAKMSLLAEIRQRDTDVEGIRKEIENITNIFSEEKDKFVRNVEEKNAAINALQIQLHDEIQYKNRLESELQHLMQTKAKLSEELADLNKSLKVYKGEIQDKDRMIYALDLYLKEEKHTNKNLKAENEKMNEELNKLNSVISAKSSEMNMLEEKLENNSVRFEDELFKKEEALELTNEKLLCEMQEKEVLHGMLITINEEKDGLLIELTDRRKELADLKQAYDSLSQEMGQNVAVIESLGSRIEKETKKYLQLEVDFDTQTSNMMAKLNDTEKKLKEVSAKSKGIVEKKTLEVETFKLEVANLNKTIETERENMAVIENERDALTRKLDEELCYKNKIETEYQNQCVMLEKLSTKFNEENALKSDEINVLKDEVQKLLSTADEKAKELKIIEDKLAKETDASRELVYQKSQEIRKLLQKTEELSAFNDELEQELKKEIASKTQAIDALQRENEQLHFTIEEDNSNHEVMIKERDIIIERLEERVRVITVQLESLRKDYETSTLTWEKTKVEMRKEFDDKDNEIEKLKEDICVLRNDLEQNVFNAEKVESDLKRQVEEIIRQNNETDSKKKDQIKKYVEEINQYEIRVINLERDDEVLRVELKNEKAAKEFLEKEMTNLVKRNEDFIEELRKEKSARQTIVEEKQAILSDKLDLEQKLFEETTIKNMLVEEKENLTAQLMEEKMIKQQLEHGEISLQEVKDKLQQKLCEELKLRSNLENERDTLLQEKQGLVQKLAQLNQQVAVETAAKDRLQEEVIKLSDSLEKESSVKEQVMKDLILIKDIFIRDKEQSDEENLCALEAVNSLRDSISELKLFKERFQQDKNMLSEVSEQNHTLQSEIVSIRKNIVEIKANYNKILEEKQNVYDENSSLKMNFAQLLEEKQHLEDENDSLKNDIVKLKVIQDTLTHENEHFCEEKQSLSDENSNLKNKIEELQDIQKSLTHAKEQIFEKTRRLRDENSSLKHVKEMHDTVIKEREQLLKEKESVSIENSTLKNNIMELNTIKDMLMLDKEVLAAEKETLAQHLSVEKAARDELESEKSCVSDTLKELQDKFEVDMREKEEQLSVVSSELQQVKLDVKKHEDISVNVVSVLESGFGKLLQNIKGDKIDNDVLQKLITFDNKDEIPLEEKCHLLISIADTLRLELSMKQNLAKALEHESTAVDELKGIIKQKEMQIFELQTEAKRLQQIVHENQVELSKQTETFNTTIDSKVKNIQTLQQENKSLNNELNDVKVQLEVKVHSLKEKLIDNETLTDKLKKTYECQIENLNVMITKLTSYLRDKTTELDSLRKEKDKMQQIIDENNKVIKTLEEEVKIQKQNQEKLISDFESERQVIKNMVTVTESIMEDQKVSFEKMIADHEKTIETLQTEKRGLEELVETTNKKADELVLEKQAALEAVFKELTEIRKEKENAEREMTTKQEFLNKEIALLKEELTYKSGNTEFLEVQNKVIMKEKEHIKKEIEHEKEKLQKEVESLKEEVKAKVLVVEKLQTQNEDLTGAINKLKDDLLCLQEKDNELKIKKDSLESELLNRIEKLTKVLSDDTSKNDKFKSKLQEKLQSKSAVQEKVKVLTDEIIDLVNEKNEYISKLDEVKAEWESSEIRAKEQIDLLKTENANLLEVIEDNKIVINNLETLVKRELEQNQKLRENNTSEKLNIENKCSLLQEYQTKAERLLQERDKEIHSLKEHVKTEAKLAREIEDLKEELTDKDAMIAKIARDKDEVINTLSKELVDEKAIKEKYEKQLEMKTATVYELRQKLEEVKSETDVLQAIKKENDDMIKAIEQRENFAAIQEKLFHKHSGQTEKELRDRHQVSTPTSDLTHSSMESFKTITDLEKIIHDKNRTITTLQSDITYLKSLMADSENKLLDVTKELEISKETCEQLSGQLKKIVHQKNEEIAELKKQIAKMSVTENRASQIIKVSAKYQAIILKRIAEIKSNTILKELTNLGNTNSDSELKRSLNTGAITMEELENFLETTDRHLKRCSEKQIMLQKERDRLIEVNRINESEIISMKKFLTELSVSFKTFNSIKDMYTQKLSRVVSVQRTVRREILSLEGHVTDATMCKLERGYAAVMQDLSECSMNLERWVERSIGRTISAEKIKQAFTNETERASMASTSYQNASLEVQLEELENSFQKLLEEVVRAQKGEGAREPQAVTVMEVRAEYEDKLNRMKAKMKQLYQEQIQVFKEKQKEEIALLERELQKTRDKLSESSRAYEEHIKALTTELWSVGEKFLMKKDEAEWLRKKQRSGSLMSLQHVHSAGLVPNHEQPPMMRSSDTHSLRSLPVHTGAAGQEKQRRGLHMSDEEGEVFDNRWLKELATPRRESNAGQRLSELRWRNSLCPPHLKSSYPAETQFAHTFDEDDIKSAGAATMGARSQRKEVGITAYKKPGPPTPSKQAGRLSATDSELRESLRVEPEPAPRKTSTPSRLRSLFRSGRSDVDGTPRKRLSNIFRKK